MPINIYTVSDGAIALPISVTNRVSGVRVAEIPSWVGSGWSLSAGGAITRSIKGSPDEGGYRILNAGGSPSLGFLNGGLAKGAAYDAMQEDFHRYQRECLGARPYAPCLEYSTPPNAPQDCNSRDSSFSSSGWLTTRDNLAKELAAGVWDTESDIYFFSFGKYSGSFRFAENGAVLQAELSDIKIVPGPKLESFVATDPDGIMYWFGKHPVTTATAYDMSWSTVARGFGEPRSWDPLKTGWHLVRVVDPNSGAEVNLEYNSTVYAEYSLSKPSTTRDGGIDGLPGPCDNYGLTVFREQLLRSIKSRTHEVEFLEGSVRKDLRKPDGNLSQFEGPYGFWHPTQLEVSRRPYALAGVRVKVIGIATPLEEYRLSYSYTLSGNAMRVCGPAGYEFEVAGSTIETASADRLRLVLARFTQLSTQTPADSLSYTFRYEGTLPSRLSNSHDHWGFATRSYTVGVYPDLSQIDAVNSAGRGLMASIPSNRHIYLTNREASPDNSKLGSLKGWTTPSGLNSDLALETHYVEQDVTRMVQVAVANAASSSDYTACRIIGAPISTNRFTVVALPSVPTSEADLYKVTELIVNVRITSDASSCGHPLYNSFAYTIILRRPDGTESRRTEVARDGVPAGADLSYRFTVGSSGNLQTRTRTIDRPYNLPYERAAFEGTLPGEYTVELINQIQGNRRPEFVSADVKQYAPYTETKRIYVGGVRVKAVTETANGLTSSTTYDYSRVNGENRLKLFSFPVYVTNYMGTSEESPYWPCAFGRPNQSGFQFHSASSEPVHIVNGTHVGYSSVKAVHSDNSTTETFYNVAAAGGIPNIGAHTLFSSTLPFPDGQQYPPSFGMAVREEARAPSGTLVSQSATSYTVGSAQSTHYRTTQDRWYTEETNTATHTFVVRSAPVRGYRIWNQYDVKLNSSSSSVGALTKTTTYTYDLPRRHHNVVSTAVASGGLTQTTAYIYPHDAQSKPERQSLSVVNEMIARNMVGVPLRSSTTGIAISGTETVFALSNNMILPASRYELRRSMWVQTQRLTYVNTDHLPDVVWSRDQPETTSISYYPSAPRRFLPQTITIGTTNPRTVSLQFNDLRLLSRRNGFNGSYSTVLYDGLNRATLVSTYGASQGLLGSLATVYEFRPSSQTIVTTSTATSPGGSPQITEQRANGFGLPILTLRKGYSPTGSDVIVAEQVYNNLLQVERSHSFGSAWTNHYYESNPLRRKTSEVRADGTTVGIAHSQTASEATVRTTSPDNIVSSVVIDGFGRTVRTVQDADATALTTTTSYHPYGPLNTVTSPGGQRFVYDYDSQGRLYSKQVPAQTLPEVYTYDAHDRLHTVRQPNNATRVNTYTQFGELETVSISGVEQIRYRYPLTSASYGIHSLGQPYEVVSKLQDGSGSVIETVLARDQFGRPKTQRTTLPWGVTDTYNYTYHASGGVESVVQQHRSSLGVAVDVSDASIFDHAFRLKRSDQTITSGGQTRYKQVASQDYNALDQLQLLRLSLNGTQRLQDVDYTYTVLGQLSTINQITESSGAPLRMMAPTTECIGCQVGSSSLAFAPGGAGEPSLAASAKTTKTSSADLLVVDVRTGGGESVPMAYPLPAADMPAVWETLGRVFDADPVTAKRFRFDAATGRATLTSGIPLDYVEFLDRARDVRFRVPFDVYDKDGTCVRCSTDKGAHDKNGAVSLLTLRAQAFQKAAAEARNAKARARAEARLAAFGHEMPTEVPAAGLLSASWWRDSLPAKPTHAFHPVQLTARFQPATLLGQESSAPVGEREPRNGKRNAPGGESGDAFAGLLQLRLTYDVVNDTGAAQRQRLHRNVPILLTEKTAPGLVRGFAYDRKVYEVTVDASDLWSYGEEGLVDDAVPVSKLALRLAAKLARAVDTAALDLSGVAVGRVVAEGLAPVFEELVQGTVSYRSAEAASVGFAPAAATAAGGSSGPGASGPGPGGYVPSVLPDVFGLALKYHHEPRVTSAPIRRSGEITEAVWQSGGRRAQAYGYTYDNVGRLTGAGFVDHQASGWSASSRYNTGYSYDADGNLTYVVRIGPLTPYNPGAAAPSYGFIDHGAYGYTTINTGKRLTYVSDNTGNPAGRNGSGAMTYSGAGELLSDQARGITVAYDLFSMPRTITTTQGRLELTYDALGRKWRQRAYSTSGALQSEEATYGAVEYRGATPYAVRHAHGRARFDNPTSRNTWTYEFVLRDHLGSSRVVLRDRYFDSRDGQYTVGGDPGDPPVYEAVVKQVDDYYPFGLRIDDQASARGQDYEFTYTGKEEVTEIGLQWHDYGARWYDPAVGRWSAVDPLAASYASNSPYAYVANNPISSIDPDGKQIEDLIDRIRYTGEDARIAFEGLKASEASAVHLVFEEFTPTIYEATNDAFKANKPQVLTYDDDKDARDRRRREATMGTQTQPGMQRDEYPYASTEEGGTGAQVTLVPSYENSLQGGQLSLLYRLIEDGDRFLVLPVPKSKTHKVPYPESVPAEVQEKTSRTKRMEENPIRKWFRGLAPVWPAPVLL